MVILTLVLVWIIWLERNAKITEDKDCGCHVGINLLFLFPYDLNHQAILQIFLYLFNFGLGKCILLRQVIEESYDKLVPHSNSLNKVNYDGHAPVVTPVK